jgi:hypothetical protein
MQQHRGNAVKPSKSPSSAKDRRKRSTSMPIWLKLSLASVLLILSLVIGLIVGFALVGPGSVAEAYDWDTYKHMYNLVFQMK